MELLIDSKTEKEWTPQGKEQMFQHVRTGAIHDLRMRDAGRGIPMTEDVVDDEGKPTGEVRDSFKVFRLEGSHFRIDRNLSAAKHTGDDTNALIASRWADYRKSPHDEVAELTKLNKAKPEKAAPQIKRGRQIEEEMRSATIPIQQTSSRGSKAMQTSGT